MANKFIPILADQPLQYAYDRPEYFRNAAREAKWGKPVYFAPSTNGYDVTGQAGPGYQYGKPYNINQGKYGNCTWWVMGRCYEVSNITLSECIGDASGFYSKYKGNKNGGSLTSGKYFGDTIKPGDILVYGDSKSSLGVGHVTFVEKVEGNTLYISESGYSTNSVYKGKACITYTLDKTKFKCGAAISLRPQSPYTKYAYGVIHTGDNVEVWEKPASVARNKNVDQVYVGSINVNIRADASISPTNIMGTFNKPNAYYNVTSVLKQSDYVWYRLGHDAYIADCDKEIVFYPKEEEHIVTPDKELEEKIANLESTIKTLQADNNKLLCAIKEIKTIVDKVI